MDFFPEMPLFYFPLGIDFRGRRAFRSGVYYTNDKNIKNLLQCRWNLNRYNDTNSIFSYSRCTKTSFI